jgi:hypothetical protein
MLRRWQTNGSLTMPKSKQRDNTFAKVWQSAPTFYRPSCEVEEAKFKKIYELLLIACED